MASYRLLQMSVILIDPERSRTGSRSTCNCLSFVERVTIYLMADQNPDPPLTVAEAEKTFAHFLNTNGYPACIRWIMADQILPGDDRHHFIRATGAEQAQTEMERRYKVGLNRGLGISLRAICATHAETVASVYIPTDTTDAQYRMIRRGLKLSCPTSLIPASLVENPDEWQRLDEGSRFRIEAWRQCYDL